MKFVYLIFIVLLLSACNGMTRGSGNIITETRTVLAFSSLKVSNSIDVEVQQGPTTEVRVEADDNIIKFIETNVEGGELRIKLKSNFGTSNATMKVYVTSPVYTAFESTSSSSIIGKGTIANTNKISLTTKNSANIELAVDAPMIELDASNSADIIASGKTKFLNADARNSATIMSSTLHAETVEVKSSNSADVHVFASLKLNATANNSADITYTGGVTDISRKENSSGTVVKQ